MNNPFENQNEIRNDEEKKTFETTEKSEVKTEQQGSPYVQNENKYSGYYSPQGNYQNPSNYQNTGSQYQDTRYSSSYSQPYTPPYRQGQYYSQPMYSQPYSQQRYYEQTNSVPKLKKKPASKGFVVLMTALSVLVSFVLGFFTSTFVVGIDDLNSYGLDSIMPGNDVIIQYAPKDENPPVITDKGDVAYVTSLVSKTVVEVTTETVATDSYYGQYITEGAGSGVIISSSDQGSYIITCAHVIERSSKIKVKLKDGTTYDAISFISDSESDIGIIKLNVKGLPYATVADFSQVVVGEEVVAIGNPLGTLGGSVTNGIVSALDRSVIIDGTTYNLLQTNAEINPGNSGGGLFNMDGHLIGIVNAKSSGDNIEGLGFAIPIDDAIVVMNDLLEKGYVSGRVKLGFSLIEIATKEDAQYWFKYYRYFTDYGVYIIESEDSNFKQGDLLIAINNDKISSLADLKALLQKFKVGQTVRVTVSRIGANNKVQIFEYELTLTEKK